MRYLRRILQRPEWLLPIALAAFSVSCLADTCQKDFGEMAKGTITENSFVVDRDLVHYTVYFSKDFPTDLANLKPGELWLDAGSGDGIAAAEFMDGIKTSDKPDVLGVTFIMKPVEKVQAIQANNASHLKFVTGKYLEDIPISDLGHPKIITDLFGVLSYTTKFDEVLQRYLDILPPDGKIFLVLNGGEEGDIFKSGESKLTALSFLQSIKGLNVENAAGGSSLVITKTQANVTVPKLKLINFFPGQPPDRSFEVEN